MKQKITIKLFIGIIILSLFTLNIHSRVWANEGGSVGFEGSNTDISYTAKKSGSIEYYIITGANYSLRAHSDIQKFLSEVEIMDIDVRDYLKLEKTLESALQNIENANIEYIKLKEMADNTPYNQTFITELVSFNYEEFETERNLNRPVFEEVESHLSLGDICGLFDKNLLNIQDLIKKIKEIMEYIQNEKYPKNYLFWRLNQKFSESHLFGQYASEVFYKISGK